MKKIKDQGEKPYQLKFSKKPNVTEDFKGSLPDWCTSRLTSPQIVNQYKFPTAEMYFQRYHHDPFYVDVVSVNSEVPFSFDYQRQKNQIFLVCMLKGNATFETLDEEHVSSVKKKHFYISHMIPGNYRIKLEKGVSIGIIITIKKTWAQKKLPQFTSLVNILLPWQDCPRPYNILPQCPIDAKIANLLKNILAINSEPQIAQRHALLSYVATILDLYNTELIQQEDKLAFQVKRYIDEHYSLYELNNQTIAAALYSTPKTINNHFLSTFHISIQQYIRWRRFKEAHYLITIKHKDIATAGIHVGYRDPVYFKKLYEEEKNKYLKMSELN